MKKVGSNEGYVDLGTQDVKAGIDPMGRGEPTVVDKRVKQGIPDRTVTFTGRAADEYHRVTSLGWHPDEAYEHANAIQKQIDASVEAGIQHDGYDIEALEREAYNRGRANAEDRAVERQIDEAVANGELELDPAERQTMGKYVEQQRVLSEEFIDYRPPGVFPEDHLPGPQLMPAVDMINHPPHYTNHPSGIEPIEICRWMMFDVGNAVKYMIRSDLKGSPKADADKARFYLVDALEQTNARIWGIPTNQHECVQAQEKLVLVAEKEPDFVKAMLFHALAEDNVPRALSAAKELLARHG